MLKVSDLEYPLPQEAVARTAAEPRDSARLLVVSRRDPSRAEHLTVRDLPSLLRPGDLLVANHTRVLPARLIGYRADTRGGVEGLFLGLAPDGQGGPGTDERLWSVLLRGRRMRAGITINLTTESGGEGGVRLALLHHGQEAEGAVPWTVRVYGANDLQTAAAVLDRVGRAPLPPYILGARKRHDQHVPDAEDRGRYQCVFAGGAAASVAAPTAGLHFTTGLLQSLDRAGVRREPVTLHVGTGTFKPVETEHVEEHAMHAEWCEIPAATGAAVATTRAAGGRVVAVGTTTARTLESFSTDELSCGGAKWTRLLLTPGSVFQHTDALMTNFHLPRSTLMAMVAALLDGRGGGVGDGVARLKELYALALAKGYRFYSYGDAMLVLP